MEEKGPDGETHNQIASQEPQIILLESAGVRVWRTVSDVNGTQISRAA